MAGHVYIDLDGTLTDPFEGISKCIAYAMERLGQAVPPDTRLRRFIGPPLLETFGELVGNELAPRALEHYRERFGDIVGALNNGFRAVGVTWGYGTADELLGAGAHCLAAAPVELPGLL